jgi:hypothetical protein
LRDREPLRIDEHQANRHRHGGRWLRNVQYRPGSTRRRAGVAEVLFPNVKVLRSDRSVAGTVGGEADVADYSEWMTGRRSTALAFASIVFGLKLGLGVGGWLNGELLEYFGYSAAAPLPPSAVRGIVMMVSIIPAMVLLISVGLLLLYRIDDRMVKQIEQALSVRRNGLDPSFEK